MSTRIISSPDLAGTEAGSSRSRSQRPIGLEADGFDEQEGTGSGSGTGPGGQHNQIRPTTSSFSLPLPPLIPNTHRARISQTAALQASISAPHRAAANSATTAPRDPSAAHHCISNFLGLERSTTQLSSSTNAAGESQSTLPIFDSFDESDLFDSPASSFSDAMPPALRRSAAARTGSTHASKRQRTSTAAANGNTISSRQSPRQKKSSAPKKEMDVEELFGSSPSPRAFIDLETNEDYDTVDLTETNEIPNEIKQPEKDDRIKLAAFQCAIFIALHACISPFA
ncbi:hypothetical protein ACHAPZ_001408 [Fusarium culmorum]